jgi:hypothetical protein
MANTRTVNLSFAGGELSKDMFGRIDDAKYRSGASLLSNFIATPQGPAENRPGFQFVRSTKNNGVARLIPFVFSPEQTMVVELGAGYFRFHTNAETLVYSTRHARLGGGLWCHLHLAHLSGGRDLDGTRADHGRPHTLLPLRWCDVRTDRTPDRLHLHRGGHRCRQLHPAR